MVHFTDRMEGDSTMKAKIFEGRELKKGKECFKVLAVFAGVYQVVVLNGPRKGQILTWKLKGDNV